MKESSESARVTFRMRRAEDGEPETVEERVVECAPEELAALLASPWETARGARPVGAQRPEEVSRAIREAVQSLRFTVRERKLEGGGRRFELGFGDGDCDEILDAEPEGQGPIDLRGGMRLSTRPDACEVSLEDGSGPGQRIQVQNNGLQVNHWGNTYVNLNLEFRCVIHCGESS